MLLTASIFFVLSCILLAIIEFSNIQFGNDFSSYIEFLLYNTTFVITKVLIPTSLILLSASLFGSDYSNGMLKTFLLCGCKKRDLFISKLIILLVCSFATVFLEFCILSCIFFFTNGWVIFNISSMLLILRTYLLCSIGIVPIILLTIIFSVWLGDFQKSMSSGLTVLLLSLSLDSVSSEHLVSPTFFLSNSNAVYFSQVPSIAYFSLVLYIAIFVLIGFILFDKKEIWS